MSALAVIGAAVVCTTLILAGVTHLKSVQHLSATLREHQLIPSQLQRPIAIMLSLSEVGFGGWGLVALADSWEGSAHRLPFVGALVLCSIFSVYSFVLLRRDGLVSCGCGPGNDPVTIWVPVRAAIFVALAILYLSVGQPTLSSIPLTSLPLVALPTIGLAFLVWLFPAVMALSRPAIRDERV